MLKIEKNFGDFETIFLKDLSKQLCLLIQHIFIKSFGVLYFTFKTAFFFFSSSLLSVQPKY